MKNILVLGDSHSRVFTYCNKKQTNINFNVVDVGGVPSYLISNINH